LTTLLIHSAFPQTQIRIEECFVAAKCSFQEITRGDRSMVSARQLGVATDVQIKSARKSGRPEARSASEVLQSDTLNDNVTGDAGSTRRRGKSLSRRIGQNGSIEVRNGAYRGRFLIDVPGVAGRVKRSVILGFVGEMTKSEARRKLRNIIAKEGLNDPAYVIPSSESFSKLVARWRESYLSRMKPSTQRTMNYHVNKYLLPQWAGHPVDAITAEFVNEWIGTLGHLAPVTLRGVVKTLQIVLGRAFEPKKIHFPSNVHARREAPCFTPEQMQRIVAGASEPYKTLFAVAGETGMRTGELYGLRAEDVDLGRCLIHVRRSAWDGKIQSPKSDNAYRTIDIPPSLAQMLRVHLGGRDSGLVFQSQRGTPLRHPRVIKKVLHPLLERLGIPLCGMHAFRHGRVSYLVENNTPIETIRAWIGHGSDQMVRLYTHLRPEYRKRVLSTIPELFGIQSSVIAPVAPLFHKEKIA
jgi:integrase